jgi:hypothetical protein
MMLACFLPVHKKYFERICCSLCFELRNHFTTNVLGSTIPIAIFIKVGYGSISPLLKTLYLF